jgi:hypothetical protein
MKLLIRSFGYRRRTVGVSGPGAAPPPGAAHLWRSPWRSTTNRIAWCRSSPAFLGRLDWRSRKAVVDWFSRYGRFPSSTEPWTSGPSGTPPTGNATLDEHVQPHHQRQHRTRSGVAPAATAQPGARLLQDGDLASIPGNGLLECGVAVSAIGWRPRELLHSAAGAVHAVEPRPIRGRLKDLIV